MKRSLMSTGLLIGLLTLSTHSHGEAEISAPRGPYLGQEPPGDVPKSFAPGIVTTDGWEYGGTFSPDLNEFYFLRETEVDGERQQEFVVFRSEDNKWSESVVSPRVGQAFISPDGKTMHLGRRYKTRTETGWSEIKDLEAPFDELRIMRLTASAKGTYFFDEPGMPDGDGVIRYSRLVDGKREEPTPMSEEINSGTWNAHPFIAPDESYVIWDGRRDSGFGNSDLYISFRNDDGTWGAAINMGDKINTEAWEAAASVTPDGKYLFFHRNLGSRNVEILWVDAQVIEDLRKSAEQDVSFKGPYDDETEQQRDARMAWWREARFGLFIHWGIYSVPAGTHKGEQIENIGEWIMHYGQIPVADYKEYAKDFNPTKYDPEAWVLMAKDAGMKYIVITAKHHDGFALFDTAVSDWNIVEATPYGKDLLKPLAEAGRKHGIKLGFYYSHAQDWTHPGGSFWDGHGTGWDPAQEGDMDKYLRDIAVPQVRELFTNYGEISTLWWDTPISMTPERAAMFDGLVDLQPGILVNNRLLYGVDGDFRTPEQHIPATGLDYDWEACQTMNTTWGYKSYDDEWKSSEQLIRNLVDVASKGGNYLLNVGPMANGEIPQASVERLKDVGDWMDVNSSSIYGTTASPFVRLKWGRATKKEYPNATDLFLHVFDWPEDGLLRVDGLRSEVSGAYFLADFQQQISFERTDAGYELRLPERPLDDVDTVIVLKVAGKLEVERILPSQDSNGVLTLAMDDGQIYNPGYGGRLELKQDENSDFYLDGWTDFHSQVDWLVRIDKPGTFNVYAEVATESPAEFLATEHTEGKPLAIGSTGGAQRFETQHIGQLTLREGESEIRLHPLQSRWSPIVLRSVTLRPVTVD